MSSFSQSASYRAAILAADFRPQPDDARKYSGELRFCAWRAAICSFHSSIPVVFYGRAFMNSRNVAKNFSGSSANGA